MQNYRCTTNLRQFRKQKIITTFNFFFKYDDFKNSSDVNVRILYGIYNFLQDERAKIININSLEVDSEPNDDDLPF